MKKIFVILLLLVMLLPLFANGSLEDLGKKTPVTPTTSTKPTATKKPGKLVFATASFGQKFSPFFATVAYDQDIMNLTMGSILTADRGGAIVENGIEGEWREYNGTNYFYKGMGNVEVVMNDDGTVDYKLEMAKNIKFSDGTPATIDDLLFSMYVVCDPTYDGASTLYALPIIGMDEYRSSMQSLDKLLLEAGEDNRDFSLWDRATQSDFWNTVHGEAGAAFAQAIVDYCVANGYGSAEYTEEENVKISMEAWGYGDAYFEGATTLDYWNAIVDAYGGDVITASSVENADGYEILNAVADVTGNKFSKGVTTGDDVKSIAGFEKTGDYTMTVHCSSYAATTIYQLAQVIAPLYYYGDRALFNGVDSFGFPKGDLSSVRAKTLSPLGCGPYVFEGYNNGVVTLKANEYYFTGKPVTETLLVQECAADADYIPGIITGTFDVATPSISDAALKAIQDGNTDTHALTGNTITTYLVDFRGYGYLGINANIVKVGDKSDSEESKALRKALMTVLAVHRETVINSYYGDKASVIEYPISNTSWAAPQPTDPGYKFAYSTDVDGNAIYTSAMSDPERYEAALNAAIGYLKKAGYTWDESVGKFTSAPEGAKMEYELLVPGAGQQDHPSFGVGIAASEDLAKIGFNLIVNDCTSTTWTNALEANTAELWCAAWQSTADPDMYQVYHSSNADGKNTNSNHYQVKSEKLDKLIMDGRNSADIDFRKATYKEAMEEIMDWAVELPVYQRKECTTTSTQRLDNSTMPRDMTPYWTWYAEVDTLAAK